VSSMPDESVVQDSNRFPGERFVIAREAKHLSQTAVADELHLPPRYIGWMEEGAFEKLPSLVFARGYIRAYAKYLNIDSNELIAAFDRLYREDSKAKPIQTVDKIQQQVKLGDPIIKLSVWVFVICLIAATVWWWQTQYGLSDAKPASQDAPLEVETADGNTLVLPKFNDPAPTDEAEQPVESEEASEAEPVYESQEDAVDESSVQQDDSQSGDVAIDQTAQSSSEESSSEAEPNEAAPQVESTTETAVNTNGLYIAFTDECWVTVKDRNGRTLFNNIRRAGDTISVSGAEPLSVNIGRRSAVSQITYNGSAVDMTPFANRDVAKFSLPVR
jgi:cytoskeleton protein RodZ